MHWWKRVIRCDQQIDKLETWINKHGYLLVKGKSQRDVIDNKKKLVCLNTRSKMESQLFSLLHECGHLHTRKNKRKFTDQFKMLIDLEDKEYKKKPLLFYVQETEDEIRAWRAGEKLAKKLCIPLNVERYYKYAARFVLSYMTYAVASRNGKR